MDTFYWLLSSHERRSVSNYQQIMWTAKKTSKLLYWPSMGPVMHSFDVFFAVSLNKLFNKQSRCWWFETPWRSRDITDVSMKTLHLQCMKTQRHPRQQSSWGQHGAHLGPVGPRWAPCWPHEPRYLGSYLGTGGNGWSGTNVSALWLFPPLEIKAHMKRFNIVIIHGNV